MEKEMAEEKNWRRDCKTEVNWTKYRQNNLLFFVIRENKKTSCNKIAYPNKNRTHKNDDDEDKGRTSADQTFGLERTINY